MLISEMISTGQAASILKCGRHTVAMWARRRAIGEWSPLTIVVSVRSGSYLVKKKEIEDIRDNKKPRIRPESEK